MNIKLILFEFILLSVLFVSPIEAAKKYEFDFETNNNEWTGDFVDYPVGSEAFYELTWAWTTLPSELPHNGKILKKGMFVSGNNHSDDLFMFIKRPIKGLKPNTLYNLYFSVIIENDVLPDLIGVGGAPGEGVIFKVGASTIQPNKVDIDGYYLLNIDKGSQSNPGSNALVVGNLANPLVSPENPQFMPKTFNNVEPLTIKTDAQGQLWLFIGTDSGFEARTDYYIAHISLLAEKA